MFSPSHTLIPLNQFIPCFLFYTPNETILFNAIIIPIYKLKPSAIFLNPISPSLNQGSYNPYLAL